MRKQAYSISAFYPVYNDEATVELMAVRLREVLSELTSEYEIIIVDDASPDKSGQIADQLAKKYKEIRVIHHEKNRGYGGALKSGFNLAKKDLIFYTDGDAQYDVADLRAFMKYLPEYDVVTGTKIKRADKIYRIIVSKIYYKIIRFLFGLQVKDVSGDFRIFKRKVVESIDLRSNSGTICLEMIKKIEKAGFKIKEVPVHHYPRRAGDSQYFNVMDVGKTFGELFPLWVELVLKPFFKHPKIPLMGYTSTILLCALVFLHAVV